MSVLTLRHGAIRRGRRVVLEPASIVAPLPGGVAVVGINGSGKSSLLMHAAGTLARQGSHPRIAVDGCTPSIAYVPQTPALPGWLSAQQAAQLYGSSFELLVTGMPALHLAELYNRRCAEMSVGQRQVLAIALALDRRAGLTLLDEPFAALDFRRRIGVIEALHAALSEPAHTAYDYAPRSEPDPRLHNALVVNRGRGIMLSSQSAAELIELCGHFVVIRDGHYTFNGARSELGADDGSGIEERLLEMLS